MPASVGSVSYPPVPDGSSEAAAAAERAFDRDTYNTAAAEVDREIWRVARMGRLREVVFGAQDGLLSTVALVTSLAVAFESQTTVVVAGLAGALPGMLSMGTGALLGSRAERDIERAEIERESRETGHQPGRRAGRAGGAVPARGHDLSGSQADGRRNLPGPRPVAQDAGGERSWASAPRKPSSPVKDALVMGLGIHHRRRHPAGAPLFPHRRDRHRRFRRSATLAGLFSLGLLKGRMVERSPLMQGLEILGIGSHVRRRRLRPGRADTRACSRRVLVALNIDRMYP